MFSKYFNEYVCAHFIIEHAPIISKLENSWTSEVELKSSHNPLAKYEVHALPDGEVSVPWPWELISAPNSGILMDVNSYRKALKKQEASFNLGLCILNVFYFPRGKTKFQF